MPGDLDMMIFYPDGKPPELFHFGASSLSEKWSGFCRDMLEQLGPVFSQNLGGNLAHFDIQMAGPMGRLLIHKKACYEFWMSRGRGVEQDQAVVSHFRMFLSKACSTVGEPVSDTTKNALVGVDTRPTMMLFDYCTSGIPAEDKTAIAQFGLHLADAYLCYCDPPNETTKA